MVCGQTVPPPNVLLLPTAAIQVWDIAQRKQVGATIATQLLPVTWNGSVADISSDGKVVAVGGRHSGKIALERCRREVAERGSLQIAQGRCDRPFARRAAVGHLGPKRLDVLEMADGRTAAHHPRGRKIDALAFSPDSRYLAEGPDVRGDIQLRDMTTLEVVRAVKDKAGSPLIVCAAALKFSADGSKLIAGNEAQVDWRKLKIPYRLYIWDVESGQLLRQIATPNHLVRGVDISPDGKHIANNEAEVARIAERESREAETRARRREAIARQEAKQLRESVEQLQREGARKQVEQQESSGNGLAAEPTPKALYDRFASLSESESQSQLRALMTNRDDTVALLAAWNLADATAVDPGKKSSLTRFVGFLEGRLGATVPPWWDEWLSYTFDREEIHRS